MAISLAWIFAYIAKKQPDADDNLSPFSIGLSRSGRRVLFIDPLTDRIVSVRLAGMENAIFGSPAFDEEMKESCVRPNEVRLEKPPR